MKKYFLIFSLILVLYVGEQKTANGLCYQMASYEKDGRPSPRSPLFDIRIFNGSEDGCFPIASKEDVGSSQYNSGIQFLFDLMIGACIALAVILFTYGAAQGILFEVNVTAKNEAKERMKSAIVGLLIVLGAWLVVNTINPDLLRLPALQSLYSIPTNKNNSSGGQPSVKVNPGSNIDQLPPNINPGTGLPNDVIVGA